MNLNPNQNQSREGYSVKAEKLTGLPQYPGFSRVFNTREEAEEALEQLEKEPGYRYSIAYVRENFNRAMDSEGNFTLSTFYEIPEPRK